MKGHFLVSSFLLLLCFSYSHAEVIEIADSKLTMNKELNTDVYFSLEYFDKMHYLPSKLDDVYSSNMLDTYIEMLDPNKLYFTQRDINSFKNNYQYELDNIILKYDATPAFEIFKHFRERLNLRTEVALGLIKSNFDYTKNESINIDKDQNTWAKNDTEMADKWRKRIKNDILSQLLTDKKIDEARENIMRRYKRQRDVTFQLKADEVFEYFMNAYVKEIDPHSQYMSNATAENFEIHMSLSLEGIGASLSTEGDYTIVKKIIKGGPAEASGLIKPEDKIIGVGQKGKVMIDVIGWRLMDVVAMIRGDKGTPVTLELLKGDAAPGSTPIKIKIVRDVIELEDQAAKLTSIELPVSNKKGAEKELYSIISIPSFYSNQGSIKKGETYTATTHDVKKLLREVKKTNSKGLVIDLRNNGGGYLSEAISLSGLFITKGPVVQVVESGGKRQVHKDKDGKVAYDGKIIVLINRYSASASEIFAAAMQDYGRAIIVGERSFGKGTVQRVLPLRYGQKSDHKSQIKFTTAQFFRINGGSTQYKGVIPDVILNAGVEDEGFGERAYDNALPWSQTKPADYAFSTFPKKLFKKLSRKHIARSKKSAAFELLRKNSKMVTENKELKSLSLNIKERRAITEKQEQKSLQTLNDYRKSLGLETVTKETKKDSKLPDEDEHWNIVHHTEAAAILRDELRLTAK